MKAKAKKNGVKTKVKTAKVEKVFYMAPKSQEIINRMQGAKDKAKEAGKILHELKGQYERLNTAVTLLTPVRKVLSSPDYFHANGRHLLSFDKSLFRKEQEENFSRQLENIRTAHTIEAVDYTPIFEKAIEWLSSKDEVIKGLALLVLTGRRTSEIFGPPCFEKVGKFRVSFTGQIKTARAVPYVIPVLHDSSTIIREQKRVSTKLTPAEINRKYAMALSRAVKYLGVKRVHDLRHIYSALAYEKFGEGRERTAYTASILGNGMMVAMSYSDTVRQKSPEVQAEIKQVREKADKVKVNQQLVESILKGV